MNLACEWEWSKHREAYSRQLSPPVMTALAGAAFDHTKDITS